MSRHLLDVFTGLSSDDGSVCNSTMLWSSSPSSTACLSRYSFPLTSQTFIPSTGLYFNQQDQFLHDTAASCDAHGAEDMKYVSVAGPVPPLLNQNAFMLNLQRPSVIQRIGQVLPLAERSSETSFAQEDTNEAPISVYTETPACPVGKFAPSGELEKRKSRYNCSFCNKPYHWRSHWQAHERTHTGERPFKCEICDKAFTRSDGLRCHKKIHVRQKDLAYSSTSKHRKEDTFRKESCRKVTSNIDNVVRPARERRFSCHVCKESFFSSTALQHHITVHTGNGEFTCHTCDRTFSKPSTLGLHMQVHTAARPYRCSLCVESFLVYENLKRHLLTHEEEKP